VLREVGVNSSGIELSQEGMARSHDNPILHYPIPQSQQVDLKAYNLSYPAFGPHLNIDRY